MLEINYYKINGKYYLYNYNTWEVKEITKEEALNLEKSGINIRVFEKWDEWNGYEK